VTKVYICKIPGILPRDIVYPPLRQQEIDRQRSEEKKLEKYWSWKLLEHAVKNETTYDFGALDFRKQENGRWECPNFHFSISHTRDHAFCCVSRRNIGIDAEEIGRDIDLRLADRILSPYEKAVFNAAENKQDCLLRLWVLKESYAKLTGRGFGNYLKNTHFTPDDPAIREVDGCYVAVLEDEQPAKSL
jgi:phosphopantetheinyl transferase